MCSGPSATAEAASRAAASTVWPEPPWMRSSETLSNPAARAVRKARSASDAECLRPRTRSCESANDWTPIDSRFTPSFRNAVKRPSSVVPGFASSVISAPRGRRRDRGRRRARGRLAKGPTATAFRRRNRSRRPRAKVRRTARRGREARGGPPPCTAPAGSPPRRARRSRSRGTSRGSRENGCRCRDACPRLAPGIGARRRTLTLRSALARRGRQRHRTVRGIVLGRHRRRRRDPSRRFLYGGRGPRREDALGFPLHGRERRVAVQVVGQLDERAGAIRRRGERLDPCPQGPGFGAELGALAPDSVEHGLQFGCSRLGLRGPLRRGIPLRPRGAQVLVRDRALGGDVSRPLDLHPARRLVELALHLAELLRLAGEFSLRGDDLLLRGFRPFDGGGELRAQRALALERGGEQGPRTAIAVRSLDLVRHRRLAAASSLELVLELRELRGDLRQLVARLLLQPLLLLGPGALARELLGTLGAQPLQLLRTGMRAGQLLR